MKKFILGTLMFLALGVVAGMLVLADHYRFVRSIEIEAEPQVVYATISDLHTWPDWTVWNLELDPQATYDFPGRPAGDGAGLTWNGPKLKRGDVTLRDCVAPTSVGYVLDLERGKHVSSGSFELSQSPTGTRVVWSNQGDLPGIYKMMGPFLENLVAPQLEHGLERLKERLEAQRDLTD